MNKIQVYQEVLAAFLCNPRGEVCIAFDDPAYVQSESILIDPENLAVHAVLHEASWLLGYVSADMVRAFRARDTALLTALLPDGRVFELTAPVITSKHH